MPPERFGQFIREYGERAFQFAYRLSGNVEEAKDLVQEAFRRALSRWEQYDPGQPMDAWYFSILRHLFLDGRKRYETRNVMSLDAEVEGGAGEERVPMAERVRDGEETALEVLERRERAQAVRAALAGLSVEHRAVLILCDMQQMSYSEIGRALGLAPGTVRSRISRARAALRAGLAGTVEVGNDLP